jgi:hypothetical protein
MQRTTLGDFELTIVSDGTYPLDGGVLFGVVPKMMWSKKVAADERNLIFVGLNSLLVRTNDKNVLIETGIGNKMPDKMVQIFGQPAQLLGNLHATGIKPEDIDIVINTHLHFDHCGWNTVRHGDCLVATFPKARGRSRDCAWDLGEGFSGPYRRYASCDRRKRREDGLLYLGSDRNHVADRPDLDHGRGLVPPDLDRKP